MLMFLSKNISASIVLILYIMKDIDVNLINCIKNISVSIVLI